MYLYLNKCQNFTKKYKYYRCLYLFKISLSPTNRMPPNKNTYPGTPYNSIFSSWKTGATSISLAEFPDTCCFRFITKLAHFNLILSSWYMRLSLQGKFIWVQFSHFKLISCFQHYPDRSVDCVLFIFLIKKKLICKRYIKKIVCSPLWEMKWSVVLTESNICFLVFISG